jgi:hypothetical protein
MVYKLIAKWVLPAGFLIAAPAVAIAGTLCTVGDPDLNLTSVERSMTDCLERLRRFDGPEDEQGRVYAHYGTVPLAADNVSSYRFYSEGNVWAKFAGTPGRVEAAKRDLSAQAVAAADPVAPESNQPEQEPADPASSVSTQIAQTPPPPSLQLETTLTQAAISEDETRDAAAAPDAPVPTGSPSAALSASSAVDDGTSQTANATPAPTIVAKVVRATPPPPCQFRVNEVWVATAEETLPTCARRIEAAHWANGGAGVTAGYWRGTFINVTPNGVYTSPTGKGAWVELAD